MRKLPVIVFALFFAIGAQCGDDEPAPIPRCDELDECSGDLFCTQMGICNCPGVGDCRRDTSP